MPWSSPQEGDAMEGRLLAFNGPLSGLARLGGRQGLTGPLHS